MRDRATLVATLILLGAIAFNLGTLWPEVAIHTPPLNDNVLHLTLIERAVEALERGEDPTDPWISSFALGYPLFHHYQHLPHVATALLYKGLGGTVSPPTLLGVLQYLLLCTFPLSLYWAGRRLGFRALPAALTGVLASLLATNGLYGLDMASYVWRGFGLYTQLWGMWLLGPAVAGLYVTLRHGRAYAGTAALLAATLLSHTVYGYAALLTGGLLVLLGGTASLGRRIGRLAGVLLLVAVVAAYFLVPFFLDRPYLNRSVWEDPGKYDAYGWPWTLRALVSGELLDAGRFPSLTLLAAVGLVACLVRWRRDERYRLIIAFFCFWLLLYFGRPTWGVLLDLLPMGGDLHLHRLIGPVHLGAIALAGAGLAWLWKQALAQRRRWWQTAAMGLLTAVLLGPVCRERAEYLALNGRWKQQDAASFQGDGGALDALLTDLSRRPQARVYAGRGGNWGQAYTIGSVPVYALLPVNGFDSPGYLYHALSLNADIEGYLDESRPATFDLFNLGYVIAPEGQPAPSFARPAASYGRHYLYQVETSGYFGLVDSESTWYGTRSDWFEAARAWIESPWVEARQHPAIVFGGTPAGDSAALPLGAAPDALAGQDPPQREPCGQILAEQVGGNRYAVEFVADRSCWLMLKQTFHPGWRATLDGRPATTHMLAPSFVGLEVSPGQHRAELRYQSGPLRAWLRVAGLVALALVAICEWQRERLAGWAGRLNLARPGARVREWAARAVSWGPLRSAGDRLRPHLPYLGGLVLITLLVGLPLLQFKIMGGHDALAYLPRSVEFFEGLKEGQLFPRWAPDLGAGYGEPTFTFNAPLIYYLTAVFHAMGLGFVAAQNLALLLLLLLAGLGMYLLAGELLGPRGGLVSAVAYLLAPYLLVTLYVRYALADFAAFAFIPLAFRGFYRFALEGRFRFLLSSALSLALLVLSSNSVALIAFPAFLLLLTLVAYTSWRRDGARVTPVLLRGLWCLLLGLGLSAFFWLPALAERDFVHVYRRLEGYLDFHNHFVQFKQFFVSPWGYGLSLPGTADEMSFALGPIHLLLVGAALLSLRRILTTSGRGRTLVLFSLILLLAAVLLCSPASACLWEGLSLLHPLQFPWRFLSLAAVSTAFLCGFPFLLRALQDRRLANGLMFAIIVALFLTGFSHAQPGGFLEVEEADYSPSMIAARGIQATARQFEPIWVQTWPEAPAPAGRLLLLSGQGQVRVLESHLTGTCYTWLIETTNPVQLRVTTFYFPGWHLTVDGQPRPLTVQNPYGLIDFFLEAGVHRVEVSFGHTPVRWLAEGLSAGSLLLLGLTGLLPKLLAKGSPSKKRGDSSGR
jgi:hypothetical protein